MAQQGLFDTLTFPERLTARVVRPGADPHLHGYAVGADLSWNVGLAAQIFLTFLGELPSPAQAEAFGQALCLLSPIHVGQAPGHAAVVARVAGTADAVLPGVAALALGQWAQEEATHLPALFACVDGGPGPLPDWALAADADVAALAAQQARLARAAEGRSLPDLPLLHLTAQAYVLLHLLGVDDRARLLAIATVARLPAVLAEALCLRPGAVTQYPARLPNYRYVEGS